MARKLSDAGPLEKFIALFDLLLTERHPVTLKEMADELGCSRQTASRLLTKLELSDVGRKYLEINRTRTVTARFKRQRGLPTLNLNAEGFFQLILCRDFMLNLLPATVRSQVDTTLKRAAEYVDGSVPVPDDLLDMGEPSSKGRVDYTPFQGLLHTIIQALQPGKVLSIGYQPELDGEIKHYFFSPLRLRSNSSTIYVRGWLLQKDGDGSLKKRHDNPSSLPLQRFRKAEITQYRFGTQEAGESAPDTFGIIEESPFTAVIKFPKSAATYVGERIWSEGQRMERTPDGSLILSLKASSRAEIVSWVLSFGTNAELLEPADLREELRNISRNLSKCYGEKKD